MELSFKSVPEEFEDSGEWIPLKFFARESTTTQPHIQLPSQSETSIKMDLVQGNFTLRGYNVNYVIENENSYTVSLCGENVLRHPLQFRWLQNSYQVDNIIRDVVMLDNVTVRVRNSTHEAWLLQDCFDGRKIE